jgi:hypothetical protein
LVEAKAHPAELHEDDCCKAGKNHKRISTALEEANRGLGDDWCLAPKPCYQLSNRFAWAWKVASLGIPVVLVYLGFLNCADWDKPFTSHAAWEKCLLKYAENCVPMTAWNSKLLVNGTTVFPLIRSADVNVTTRI